MRLTPLDEEPEPDPASVQPPSSLKKIGRRLSNALTDFRARGYASSAGPHAMQLPTQAQIAAKFPQHIYSAQSNQKATYGESEVHSMCWGLFHPLLDFFKHRLLLLVVLIILLTMVLGFESTTEKIYILEIVVSKWLLLGCFGCILWLVAMLLQNSLVFTADLLSHTRLWKVWFYYSSVEEHLAATTWISLMYSFHGKILGDPRSPETLLNVGEKILLAATICQYILIVRQFFLKWLLWQLEAKNFIDRANRAKENEVILARLIKVAFSSDSGRTPRHSISHSGPLPPKALFQTLSAVKTQTSVPSNVRKRSGSITLLEDLRDIEKMMEVRSEKKARKLALKLWEKLNEQGKGGLELCDFQAWFPSAVDSERAYLRFKQGISTVPISTIEDIDGPLFIDMDTFFASIQRMREQRLALSTDLQSFSSVFSVLNTFIIALYWIIVPLVVASTLGASLNTIVLTVTSILVSSSFALGSVLSRMVESAYFMIITRPFKVGDRIRIGSRGNDIFIVQSISLMSTSATMLDNHLVILSNLELSRDKIFCLNRTEGSTLNFEFQVSIETPPQKFEEFKTCVKEYLKINVKDFKPSSFALFYNNVDMMTSYTVAIWVTARHKWQDGGVLWPARSSLLQYITETFKSLEIKYYQPSQRIHTYPHAISPLNTSRSLLDEAEEKFFS
jgi:small-conductance mechanosensitive channel